ncbi:hypothetical protein [Actinocorallia aurantiaca]|uniref:Uncharacterized protein n=1 Tax=Actinocorallia aurantiaca TaxID=46204 RepID=A0ABP6HC37_9ACTN
MVKRVLWEGLVAGTAGAVVMTLGEKAEQRLTGRPDSYVPARVLERLTGMAERPGRRSEPVNWAMHLGQGAVLGVLRSVMAHAGLRGPWSSAKFAVVRLTNDQILENATGVGAPPAMTGAWSSSVITGIGWARWSCAGVWGSGTGRTWTGSRRR